MSTAPSGKRTDTANGGVKTLPNNSWMPTAGTSTSPLTATPTPSPTSTLTSSSPSANDTVVLAGSSAAIIDTSHNAWTITSLGQVAINGITDIITSSVVELAYVNGTVWMENQYHQWWGETQPNDSWMPTGGTTTSPLTATPTPTSTQTASTTLTTSSTATDSLVLNMSEDAWQGDAQFTVSVNGQQVGGTETVSTLHSSGDSSVFVLTGSWGSGPQTVQIQFTNDLYGGSPALDRNLYVSSIAYDGVSYSGTTATMLSNGTDSFAVAGATPVSAAPADTLTVHLSEDAWQGNAQFSLSIDGKQISTPQDVVALHSAGAWEDFTFSGNFGAGSHTIGVTFGNDAYGGTPSTDRNLYVNGIDLNGQHYGTGTTALMSNGMASFTVATTH